MSQLQRYEAAMDGSHGCWARYRAEILAGAEMDSASACAYMEGFIGALLRDALTERDRCRRDLLVVLGIADYMSEQLDHAITGLSGEEEAMCDNLSEIRRRHFTG
jgi:hypothetical protein